MGNGKWKTVVHTPDSGKMLHTYRFFVVVLILILLFLVLVLFLVVGCRVLGILIGMVYR